MMLADLSLWTTREEFCRGDVDTGGTVAVAAENDRLQVGRLDDAATGKHSNGAVRGGEMCDLTPCRGDS